MPNNFEAASAAETYETTSLELIGNCTEDRRGKFGGRRTQDVWLLFSKGCKPRSLVVDPQWTSKEEPGLVILDVVRKHS